MACSNNSNCDCDYSYCIGNSYVLENQEKQVYSYYIVHLIPMIWLAYCYAIILNFIRRVLFSYMEDTRAIHNPIYSDTDGAYPDSKEDEVQYCYYNAIPI